jgi:hypothetical protein
MLHYPVTHLNAVNDCLKGPFSADSTVLDERNRKRHVYGRSITCKDEIHDKTLDL